MIDQTKIIDGKKLALEHEIKLKKQLEEMGFTPQVVSILVGDDPASVLYTSMKQKKAQELGINFTSAKFEEDTDFNKVVNFIDDLNADKQISGIMIQLPLPSKFLKDHQTVELINKISPDKDIDGLREDSPFMQATVRGVISILESENIIGKNKKFIVVGGLRGMVGKVVVKALKEMEEDVTGVSKEDPNLANITKQADVLISAIGSPHLITGEMVSDGVLAIDVGTEKLNGKLTGDIDFDTVAPKASKITPVPGGVGPMTVISLMENVVDQSLKAT